MNIICKNLFEYSNIRYTLVSNNRDSTAKTALIKSKMVDGDLLKSILMVLSFLPYASIGQDEAGGFGAATGVEIAQLDFRHSKSERGSRGG